MCQHLLKRQGDKGVQGLYACARHLHLLFPRVCHLSNEKKKDFKISRTFLKNRKLLLLLFSHWVVPISFVTPWMVASQTPLSLGFPRQEYWTGLPFPSTSDLSNPGVKLKSPELQAGSLPLSHLASPPNIKYAWAIASFNDLNGEGNGNPLQYSCLENPMDRGDWWATVHGIKESLTWLSD